MRRPVESIFTIPDTQG